MLKSLRIFLRLLARDWAVARPSLVKRVINASVWVSVLVVINHVVMPRMGVPANFGFFIYVSGIVSQMLFQATSDAMAMIADLNGDRQINYYFVLPIPKWLLFLRYAITTGLKGLFLAVASIPLGKLILQDSFDVSIINVPKMLLIFAISGLFWGVFSLWFGTVTPTMAEYENTWSRFAFPMWFFGCYTFTYAKLTQAIGSYAMVALFNPTTYAMEGVRVAFMGQDGMINFWICCGALLLFTSLFGLHGYCLLKRRLDFV